MKTVVEINGYRSEIDPHDLGWELHHNPKLKVFLVPESDLEVRDQQEKAAAAAEEQRSFAMNINRPNKSLKEKFFKNVRPAPPSGAVPDQTLSWRVDSIWDEAGIVPPSSLI
jgi:hypothetical protein